MIRRALALGLACGSMAVAGSLLLPALPAAAQGEAPLDGATLYKTKTCIACHGPDAKTPLLPEYPKLAGQNAAYMYRQMLDIKSGARANGNTPAMRGVMHLVDENEMKTLSEYLAGLTP